MWIMTSRPRLWPAGIFLGTILLLSSCDSLEVYRVSHRGPGLGHGPPAHAQAHGYRRKQVCGYELTYDSDSGVYVVIGMTDHYYHDGHFYRLHGGLWQISVRADGDWRPVVHESLPPGLRVKKGPKGKGYAKGRK
jgi:hypothetical protein